MSNETHKSPNLKLVMLFDTRNQTYCVCSHNLTAEEASQELEKLRREGLPAFTVEQRSRHRAEDAEGCRACRADVAHAIESMPGRSEPEPGSPKPRR
jgi:hypothetical protein